MATFRGSDGKDDIFHGTKFKDSMFGKGGDDKLYGNGGKDILVGHAGNDKLVGGSGDDSLTGGKGSDTFVFTKNGGKDMVTDFDVKKDVLQIAKGLNGIKSADDVLKHASQDGHDVVINLGGGNTITLKDVKIADLKKNPGDHFDIG